MRPVGENPRRKRSTESPNTGARRGGVVADAPPPGAAALPQDTPPRRSHRPANKLAPPPNSGEMPAAVAGSESGQRRWFSPTGFHFLIPPDNRAQWPVAQRGLQDKGGCWRTAERWLSGLRRTPGKRDYSKGNGGSNPPLSSKLIIEDLRSYRRKVSTHPPVAPVVASFTGVKLSQNPTAPLHPKIESRPPPPPGPA